MLFAAIKAFTHINYFLAWSAII